MDSNYEAVMQEKNWNRIVLNTYWIFVGIYILSTLLFNALSVTGHIMLFQYSTAIPGSELIILFLITEWIMRAQLKWLDVALVIAGNIGVFICIHALFQLDMTVALLILPLTIAATYFRLFLLIVAECLALVTFIVSDLTIYQPQHTINLQNFITILTIIVTFNILLLILIRRGQQLIRGLQEATQSRQDLLIQSVVMEQTTKIDPLTKLYNRRAFHDYLEKLLDTTLKFHIPLHLAVIDIDNFKLINDTYGHDQGDEVLKQVARRIQNILTPDDFAARYGGEEFVILGVNKAMPEFYQSLDQLRQIISEDQYANLDNRSITVSIGVRTRAEADDDKKLFHLADAGLYRAKRNGKNQIIVVTEENPEYSA